MNPWSSLTIQVYLTHFTNISPILGRTYASTFKLTTQFTSQFLGVQHHLQGSKRKRVQTFYNQSLDVDIVDELCLCNLVMELCATKFEIECFTRELGIMFNKVPSILRKKFIPLGDLNFNLLITEDSHSKLLSNFMRSHYLAPVIEHPTRYDHNLN